ncbi:right-handed parallel beta-helix repeat-containing protein [Candidatus Woesearchaeota archaeon]|nr:right-handed parallel beta-helix repeat-containing protein [Candidatus Woesearchaeota archaeon]
MSEKVEPSELEATLFGASEFLEGGLEALRSVDSYVTILPGNYDIPFDITVHPGGRLEILPGTTLRFGPEGGIISYGTLIARGDKSDKIRFTGEGWRNITLAGEGSNQSVLEHCIIEGGTGRSQRSTGRSQRSLAYFKAGGGLGIFDSSSEVLNCDIRHNSARKGGGVYVSGGNPRLSNNKIHRNIAISLESRLGEGGGIYLQSSDAVIAGNTIDHNQARLGGGICIRRGKPTLTENMIQHNSASRSGGGIFIEYSNAILSTNTFEYNEGKSGAAIHLDGPATLEDNVISYNRSERNVVYGPVSAVFVQHSGCHFSGNTISGNTSYGGILGKRGAGLVLDSGRSITFNGDRIFDNEPLDILQLK